MDLLFDLRERTDWTSNSHACWIDLFHLVLSYLVLFQSVDQFLANTHDIGREMSPLHLRLIQRFLGEVLFLLKHDHSFLHLRQSVRNFISVNCWHVLPLRFEEHVENLR